MGLSKLDPKQRDQLDSWIRNELACGQSSEMVCSDLRAAGLTPASAKLAVKGASAKSVAVAPLTESDVENNLAYVLRVACDQIHRLAYPVSSKVDEKQLFQSLQFVYKVGVETASKDLRGKFTLNGKIVNGKGKASGKTAVQKPEGSAAASAAEEPEPPSKDLGDPFAPEVEVTADKDTVVVVDEAEAKRAIAEADNEATIREELP